MMPAGTKRRNYDENLAWWSEHPSELPLLLLTAVVTHLLIYRSLRP
jgi:hypothetical protein